MMNQTYLMENNASDLDTEANRLITELTDQDSILPKLNPDKDEYSFLHPTFQTYFTALYLKYQIENDQETGIFWVKQYLWDYDWHETIILLTGLLDEPIVLIKAIMGEKDDIFNTQLLLAWRCLGKCEPQSDSLIEDIINRVIEFWKYNNIESIGTVLIKIGRTYHKAVERLIEVIHDKNHYVMRWRATEALGKIGNEKAVEGLIMKIVL